jgi:uncharacterized protein (TIGR02217 family)
MPVGFKDIRFPTDISYGSSGGPGYSTGIVSMKSGKEKRNINWEYPRSEYDVAYGIEEQDELELLVEMFHVVYGKAFSFRYWDPIDYKSCRTANTPTAFDQNIGTGDGSTAEFQLYKNYSKTALDSTVHIKSRKITKPVRDTTKIGVGGVLWDETLWTIDTSTGKVTFSDWTRDINSVDTTNNYFVLNTMPGDKLKPGAKFRVKNSTGNDGTYTVDSVSDYTVYVKEDITDSTADGSVYVGIPASGEAITAGYEFDVHARFNVDQISVNLEDYRSGSIDVPVIEMKD